MRKGIVATIVGIAALGLAASAHYVPRHYEQRKIDDIPQVVQQTEQTRAKVRGYFFDGFIICHTFSIRPNVNSMTVENWIYLKHEA